MAPRFLIPVSAILSFRPVVDPPPNERGGKALGGAAFSNGATLAPLLSVLV